VKVVNIYACLATRRSELVRDRKLFEEGLVETKLLEKGRYMFREEREILGRPLGRI
jgi:hypothetical protein